MECAYWIQNISNQTTNMNIIKIKQLWRKHQQHGSTFEPHLAAVDGAEETADWTPKSSLGFNWVWKMLLIFRTTLDTMQVKVSRSLVTWTVNKDWAIFLSLLS